MEIPIWSNESGKLYCNALKRLSSTLWLKMFQAGKSCGRSTARNLRCWSQNVFLKYFMIVDNYYSITVHNGKDNRKHLITAQLVWRCVRTHERHTKNKNTHTHTCSLPRKSDDSFYSPVCRQHPHPGVKWVMVFFLFSSCAWTPPVCQKGLPRTDGWSAPNVAQWQSRQSFGEHIQCLSCGPGARLKSRDPKSWKTHGKIW